MLLFHVKATVLRTNERLFAEEALHGAETRLLNVSHVHRDTVHLRGMLPQTSLLGEPLVAYLTPKLALELRLNGESPWQLCVVCCFHVCAELLARSVAELTLGALEPPLVLRATVDALPSLRPLFQLESRVSDQRSEHFIILNRRRCVFNVTRACHVSGFLEFYRTNVERLQQPSLFESINAPFLDCSTV